MNDRRESGDIILDRRQASRLPVHFNVVCAFEGASFEGTARNLTLHGIFVETDEVVPSGASLELALSVPDGEGAPAKVRAEVRRPARRRDENPGFGADFVALDERVEERLRAVLKVAQQRAFGSS